jgi:hypothetical protein
VPKSFQSQLIIFQECVLLFKKALPFHGSFLDQGTQRYQDAKAPNKQQMHLNVRHLSEILDKHGTRVQSNLLMLLTFSLASTLINITGSIIENT